jgi:YggT family protein
VLLSYLGNFLSLLFQILTFAILIRALLSWFPLDRRNPLIQILDQITEPVLMPLRRIIPNIGMIDISPFVAIILLQVLQRVVAQTLM